MAFDPTLLQTARATINDATRGKITQNNLRIGNFGAARAMLDGAPLLISGLDELKKSPSQQTQIPVFNKIPAGTETLRKCAGVGTGATAMVPVNYTGITEEFNLSMLDTLGNEMTRDMAFTYLVQQKSQNMYKRINDFALAYLDSQKSTINNGTYFAPPTAGVTTVPFAQRNEFFAGIEADMLSNNFSGVVDAVTGNNMRALYNFQQAQGAQNGTNLEYQLSNVNPYFTSVPKDADTYDKAYVYERGTVGLYTWLRPDFKQTKDIGTDVWMTFRLPALPGAPLDTAGQPQGLEVELKVKYGCVGEAEYTESYVMHIDIAGLIAYAQSLDTGLYAYRISRA